MSIEVITILIFAGLMLLLVSGLPLAFCFGGVALFASLLLWGPKSIHLFALTAFGETTSFIIVAVPLFVFMANILETSGIAEDLYAMMYTWFGRIKGGLAIGTIVISAIFAAMAGISGVATITMGLIALPSMLNRGYDKLMSVGCISAGGTLGILIPPSLIMILYADLTDESVGQLFIGGILPGILISLLFIIYIAVRCAVQPRMGPSADDRTGFVQKVRASKGAIWPLMLILLVLGVIYRGVCTPTEASGIGAGGALLCSIVNRRLTWNVLRESLMRTLRVTSMVMWLLIGALSFTHVYTGLGAPQLINEMISGLDMSRWLIIIFMQMTFFVLGMFMDPAGIIMICTPIYIPIVETLGFDTLWFGILFVINMEMGYITPPFGFNLFYMKAVTPNSISMTDIYRSVFPFVICMVVGLAIVMMFPQLALWLPSTMVAR